MRNVLLSLAVLSALSACTFVKMAPGAEQVSVAAQGKDMANCEKRGEVVVSVKDRLGPYQRDQMRVIDELETLARNEAPSLRADTVQPKAPPVDGEQRFFAYRCSGAKPMSPEPAEDKAETVPLEE